MHRDAVGFGKRQRAEDDGVDDRVDGGGGADGQAQQGDGRDGESPVGGQ